LNLTRSLLVVLVPGVIALAPWLIWSVREFDNVGELYGKYKEAVTVGVFASVVIFGSVIEILNSWIESNWDRLREVEYRVSENWFTYLAHTFDKEPIGYGYISRMVTTMYFELALVWALPVFAMGAIVMNVTSATASICLSTILAIVGLGLAVAAYRSAKESHRVLCMTRLELNKRIGK